MQNFILPEPFFSSVRGKKKDERKLTKSYELTKSEILHYRYFKSLILHLLFYELIF